MTDDRDIAGANEDGKAGRPTERGTLVQLNLRRRQIEAATMDAADTELDARGQVLANLTSKMVQLFDAATALRARQLATQDPVDREEIRIELADVRDENERCLSRFHAIDAGAPFNDPGPDAENALLAAINAVGIAIANTAALSALLAATHQLVEAYRAQST